MLTSQTYQLVLFHYLDIDIRDYLMQ